MKQDKTTSYTSKEYSKYGKFCRDKEQERILKIIDNKLRYFRSPEGWRLLTEEIKKDE